MAANAWMNEPAGFTLNSDGEVVDVDPLKVFFNEAWPYEASHMLVAAYLVGGFLVASVHAVGMLRGRRDRYHRLGFRNPFTVATIATPVQMMVGDTLARWVYDNEPTRFAAIELMPETESDVPETLLGRIDSDGNVTGGIAIPGLASWLADPGTGTGTSTEIQGLDSLPADERPTTRQANTVHLAWDVMVGLGTALYLLSAWYGGTWLFRRDMPRSKLFLRLASVAGVAAVLAMDAGWVVTEVGRQPWIVRGHMRVDQAATSNGGVWITFIVVVRVYLALATTVVLVLRNMSRRFRRQDALVDGDVPYGPREAPAAVAGRGAGRWLTRWRWSCSSQLPPTRSSAARTSAPASGTSWPAALIEGRGRAHSSTTRSDRSGRPTTSG